MDTTTEADDVCLGIEQELQNIFIQNNHLQI